MGGNTEERAVVAAGIETTHIEISMVVRDNQQVCFNILALPAHKPAH